MTEPQPETERNEEGHPMAACVLTFSEDGKVLAVSRKDAPNDFGLPGGKVDNGETPKEAAARELEEETGLTVVGLKQVFDRYDGSHHTYVFAGDVSGTIDTDEVGVIRWVEPHILLTQSRYASFNREMFRKVGIDVGEPGGSMKERVVRFSPAQVRTLIREEVGRINESAAPKIFCPLCGAPGNVKEFHHVYQANCTQCYDPDPEGSPVQGQGSTPGEAISAWLQACISYYEDKVL